MPPKHLPTVIFDLAAISNFFRSCALTIATQQTSKLEWVTYRDSKVLNAAYAVLFWKEPPGFAELREGSRAQLQRLTDELHQRYLLTWVRKLAEDGPAAAARYVNDMAQLRAYAQQALNDLYREIGDINAEVGGETQQAINRLAKIKLGAQVGVAVIGAVTGVGFVAAEVAGTAGGAGMTILGLEAGVGGTGFTVAGASHSIIHSVIKTWEGGAWAEVAGVTLEAGVAAIGEHFAGKSLENALRGGAQSQQIIRSAQGEIAKYSQRLAEEGLKRKAREKAVDIMARRTAQIQAQRGFQAGFQTAALNAARVGKIIPVAFAAWDIWDAVDDYRETVR